MSEGLNSKTDSYLGYVVRRAAFCSSPGEKFSVADGLAAVEELKRRANACAYGPTKRAEFSELKAALLERKPESAEGESHDNP